MNFENYTQEKHTIDLGKANLVGLYYFALFGVSFYTPFYLLWGFEPKLFPKEIPAKYFIFLFPLFFILGIIIHEFIHGIFFARYATKGFKSIKFGVLWKMLTPYCHCKEPLKIKHYKIALLAPLLIVGVLPSIIGIATGNLLITLFGIFFSGAAAGDLMIFGLIKKENPEDYVQDHPSEAGYYIFRKN